MVALDQERILLIGDRDRHVHQTLSQVLPSAEVTSVPSYFDAICEMLGGGYTTVLASAEPIERRPEAAVKALRDLAGDGRLMLFGHPTLEPLSRKMLEFGCDDYIVTPLNPAEMQQMFGTPPMRLTADSELPFDDEAAATAATMPAAATPTTPTRIASMLGLPLAEIVLDAILQHPAAALDSAVKQINTRIGPTLRLARTETAQPIAADEGMQTLSHALRHESAPAGWLHLTLPQDDDESSARHALSQVALTLSRLLALEDRHKRLQRLAITDELTGIYNGRYFRHMLGTLLSKAKDKRFTVTLLLFDIDNFKSYNDRYGHGMGDEILKQTSALMKRCCRPHDVVARISGDEFAVVFWEKEGPRTPRDPSAAATATAGRVPSSVRAVCDRFRRLVSSPDFGVLGATGKGTLTISGGLAVYPFDASSVDTLIEAADRALMFDAKKSGKNSIFLVGNSDPAATEV